MVRIGEQKQKKTKDKVIFSDVGDKGNLLDDYTRHCKSIRIISMFFMTLEQVAVLVQTEGLRNVRCLTCN